MEFYLDGNEIYCEYFHENAQSDMSLTRYVNLQNVELGSHSFKARLVHKGWSRDIYTPEVEVEINDYVPSFKEFSLDKETVTGNEDVVVSLNIENARRVRSVSVYSDDVVIWNSGSSEEPAISEEITIPGSVLGNGIHGIRAEIESLDMKNVSRTYSTEALTINAVDVEPRATKLEAREDGDSIVLDISTVNMKGASYATIYVDDKDTERYDLSGSSTWDKSITFEKWRLGDGEHTFAVHVGSGAMMSNELGSASITITGVSPVISKFTVEEENENVVAKINVENAAHVRSIRVIRGSDWVRSEQFDDNGVSRIVRVYNENKYGIGDGVYEYRVEVADHAGHTYVSDICTVDLSDTLIKVDSFTASMEDDRVRVDLDLHNADGL